MLRGCEETAWRKVGVTLNDARMETVGAHGCAPAGAPESATEKEDEETSQPNAQLVESRPKLRRSKAGWRATVWRVCRSVRSETRFGLVRWRACLQLAKPSDPKGADGKRP